MTECNKIIGRIHSVETFGSVDGPGVRYCIFLQGCDMRCRYCHNPETWSKESDDAVTPEEALKAALRYKTYWKDKGGITVSGGEALLQIDFVTELFRLAKQQGVNTVLDTSGNPFREDKEYLEKFDKLMAVTDLFILDIKHIDSEKHKWLTGHGNENILAMAKYLSDNNKDMWIRHVLVPTITDDENDLKKLGEFVKSLSSVKRFEILPYHTLGLVKWDKLGWKYSLEDIKPPTYDEIKRAETILDTKSYNG